MYHGRRWIQEVKQRYGYQHNFKDGKPDDYKLLAEVPVNVEHALVSVKDLPSEFYKVCIEASGNMINRWVIVDGKERK
jgi:hypothetical protein